MSEIKLISPLLDGMEIVTCIQSGGGTSVYLLRSTADGRNYVLKHISVPESQTQVDALLFTGAAADTDAAQAYYEQLVNDYKDEFADLDALRGSSNFATYLDYQICPKEEGVGFEIYLLSEKWPTLVEYLGENAMTHLKALNLGLDLCTALCDLRAHGLIHRDIKPENIYLNGLNGFMLGDLGVARIDNLKYCAMPERMVTEYTAPEMTDILNSFNTTIDIYSVGMVLYRILNGNHGPFEDEKTSPKAANKLRISGEPLPAPLYSDYELTEIILKACAFEPTDRYQTPDELMQDLVLYMKRNSVTDSLIVPPIITDPDTMVPPELLDEEIEPVRFADVGQMDEQFVESFSPDTATHEEPPAPPEDPGPEEAVPDGPAFAAPPTTSLRPEEEDPSFPPSPAPPPETKKRSKRKKVWILSVSAVVLLAVIGVSLYFLVFGGPPIHIGGISVTDRGSDFLTVAVDVSDPDAGLSLRCVDAYGNVFTEPYTGEAVTFSGLSAGTQYTVSAVSESNKRLTGSTSSMFTTVATTEIVSFTASSSMAGQVELQLSISGPSPEEWTVRYSTEGQDPQETAFSGTSVTIFNLETSKLYTFELVSPEDIELTGTTSLEFFTGPEVVISDLAAASLSESSVRVTWSCGEDAPEEWTVTCTGTDGTVKTQTVTECQAEFTGLTAGETYTLTVTSAGTKTPATTTVTPSAATVEAVTATAQDNGTVQVSWTTDVEDAAWKLVYTLEGSDISRTVDATGTSATLSGMVPGETYQIELRSGAGEKLSGNATATVELPAAGSFGSYGATRFFLGLFVRPAAETWTASDLTTMSEPVFRTTDGIVFALESLTGRDSSDDSVELIYVVENSQGVPVSTGSRTASWDDLWTDNLILGEVAQTPVESGDYTLQIYLNGQSAGSKEFTVQ